MKKTGKRMTAIFLALAMVVTLIPVLGIWTVHADGPFEPIIDLEKGNIRLYTYTPYAGMEPEGIKSYQYNIHPVDLWPQIRIVESWEDLDGNEVTGTFIEGKEYRYTAAIQSLAGTGAGTTTKDISGFTVEVYNWATEKPIVWPNGAAQLQHEVKQANKNYVLTYTASFKAEAPPKRDQGTYVVDLESGQASVRNDSAFRWAYVSMVSESYDYYGYSKPGSDYGLDYEGVLDLDRDGTMDLGINFYDSYFDGVDGCDFFKLPECSIKDEYSLIMPEPIIKSFVRSELDHYSKLRFVFKMSSIKGAIITGITDKTYTGKPIEQKPIVKLGNTLLKNGTDYTVSYNNNTKVGTAKMTITGKGDYSGIITRSFKIAKATNPLTMKAKTATVKYSKLKKKNQTLAVTKVIKFTKDAKDKKNYTLSSAKKGSKSFKNYFKINKTTGKVTVKKGLKKGTYKVKVKVKAAGNANYKPSAWKTVTFKIIVK